MFTEPRFDAFDSLTLHLHRAIDRVVGLASAAAGVGYAWAVRPYQAELTALRARMEFSELRTQGPDDDTSRAAAVRCADEVESVHEALSLPRRQFATTDYLPARRDVVSCKGAMMSAQNR